MKIVFNLCIFLFYISPSCLSRTYINVNNVVAKYTHSTAANHKDLNVCGILQKGTAVYLRRYLEKNGKKKQLSILFYTTVRTNQVDYTAMQFFIITSP